MSDELRTAEAIKMMRNKLAKTASQLGVFLEAESKARTPVDTGHLRRSTTHKTNVKDTKAEVFVGSNVEYDPYVELGIGQKAQPHHLPAITENVKEIQQIIIKGMSVDENS